MADEQVLNTNEILKRLQARQFRTKVVEVPGWGQVNVRELSATEQTEVGGLMAHLYKPGMGAAEATAALLDGQIGTMGPAMVLAAAFGLGLTKQDVPHLDRSPELVQMVAPVVFDLSGLNEVTKKNSAVAKRGD